MYASPSYLDHDDRKRSLPTGPPHFGPQCELGGWNLPYEKCLANLVPFRLTRFCVTCFVDLIIMSDPGFTDYEAMQNELVQLEITWLRVKHHRNGPDKKPTGEKLEVKTRMEFLKAALAAAATVDTASPAAALAQPDHFVPSAPAQAGPVSTDNSSAPPDAGPARLAQLNLLAPTVPVPGPAQIDAGPGAASMPAETHPTPAQSANPDGGDASKEPLIKASTTSAMASVLDGIATHQLPTSIERSNATGKVALPGEEDGQNGPSANETEEVDHEKMQVVQGNEATAKTMVIGEVDGFNDANHNGPTTDEEIDEGANKNLVAVVDNLPSDDESTEKTVGRRPFRIISPSKSYLRKSPAQEEPEEIPRGEGENTGLEKDTAVTGTLNEDDMDVDEQPDMRISGDAPPGTSLPVLTADEGSDSQAKKEENDDQEGGNGIDDLMKTLVMSGPHYSFIVPGSVEELLEYDFRSGGVEWDDVQHSQLLKKDDEQERDFQVRRLVYMKTYEIEYTEKQRDHLLQLIEALKGYTETGAIGRDRGHSRIKLLESELPVLKKRLEKLKKELEKAKKEYDVVLLHQSRIAEEKRLRAEKEHLDQELLSVDDSELPAVRQELRDVVEALQEIVDAIQKGRKKRKKNEDDEELRYYRLSEDERTDFVAKAKAAISAVIGAKDEATKKKALEKLEFKARRAAREVQDFLPELAYTTKELAIIVHFTSSKNFVCRYHQRNRGHVFHDKAGEFTGVAFPKDMSSAQRGRVVPPIGHMHCGCSIDDALFDFFIWKTQKSFSTNPRLSHHLYYLDDTDMIPPKIRRFWIEHWKAVTCLTINDIYGGDAADSGWVARLAALSMVRQIARFSSVGMSISISHATEDGAEAFAELLRAGERLRPGAVPIEVKAETVGGITCWTVEEKLPESQKKA